MSRAEVRRSASGRALLPVQAREHAALPERQAANQSRCSRGRAERSRSGCWLQHSSELQAAKSSRHASTGLAETWLTISLRFSSRLSVQHEKHAFGLCSRALRRPQSGCRSESRIGSASRPPNDPQTTTPRFLIRERRTMTDGSQLQGFKVKPGLRKSDDVADLLA